MHFSGLVATFPPFFSIERALAGHAFTQSGQVPLQASMLDRAEKFDFNEGWGWPASNGRSVPQQQVQQLHMARGRALAFA